VKIWSRLRRPVKSIAHGRLPESLMELEEYGKMFELEDHHWWFQSRLQLTRRVLDRYAPQPPDRPADMLDMGCGTGMFLERQGTSRKTFGLDFSREALAFTRQRGLNRLVCGDSQKLPFRDACFDIVTAFDLIEHVDRDDDLVAEVHRILRPDGILLSTVPVHPALWSEHDVALHHKRRYRRRQFENLFDPSLWKTLRSTYTFASIAPPAAVVRTLRRVLPASKGDATADTNLTPDWLNSLLIRWHTLENAFIGRFDSPLGLSLMAVNRKLP
jgi:SAM-dependent methyltransferase